MSPSPLTSPLILILLSLSSLLLTTTSNDDVSSLLSLNHTPWSRATTHHCTWPGITCNGARVISINLTSQSTPLTLTLTPAIGNLSELRVLSLPHASISGEIPPELSSLRHLHVLNLSFNRLSGTIPVGLIGSGTLRVLDLSNNELSGTIDVKGCEVLEHLKLSNNFLVGNVPVGIGECSRLRTLLIDGNILEGGLPAEIGRMSELRVLDVSRNSLTDSIPREIGRCRKLAVVVLTNLVDYGEGEGGERSLDVFRGEYNAFVGGVPREVLMIPALRVLWAPRGNIGGRLSGEWTEEGCALRVVNLGENYIGGTIPESIGRCRNLTFLDLSSNGFSGRFPSQVRVSCMVYLNVSRNSLSGNVPSFVNGSCGGGGVDLLRNGLDFLEEEDVRNAYSSVHVWGSQLNSQVLGEGLDDGVVVISHDFSWNNFTGLLPLVTLSDGLFVPYSNASYRLFLNNNGFDGRAPDKLLSDCSHLCSFSVNLSANQLSGKIGMALLQDCVVLTAFEAAQNRISGLDFSGFGSLRMLSRLDLRENRLSGSLPEQLGHFKALKSLLLGGNIFAGEITSHIGQLTSLEVLDLSKNNFTGPIPTALAKATDLQVLLLDHNVLTGEIPLSFSSLSHLVVLDVSYNNLTGHIPHLQHIRDCESFKGNKFLHFCPDPYTMAPAGLPYPLEVHKWRNRSKKKSLIIATATSVSVVLGVLLMIVLGITVGRKKLSALTSLTRKVVVTFVDVPVELTYDNVVSATGNFSIRNLIGTGGFGSTYKAELVPGYLVAVKRLSIGKFQGIQQFEAEIKTLGRVRHKNLVTLIGYYVGETEMFLIYNYLSGGNLETFIHDRSAENVRWPTMYKIVVDVAHALAYLHYSCVPRIVHRDIKPSNILLDEELNAYLSDFGLARMLEVSQTHATTDVLGTFGYVAPEYATTYRVSDKADVYSFGVVLLELMSGKKSFDPSFSEYGNGFNIVGWATLLMDEERCSEFFFPELWEAGPEQKLLKMMQLALSCTVESLTVRPSMKQVLEKLKHLSP